MSVLNISFLCATNAAKRHEKINQRHSDSFLAHCKNSSPRETLESVPATGRGMKVGSLSDSDARQKCVSDEQRDVSSEVLGSSRIKLLEGVMNKRFVQTSDILL